MRNATHFYDKFFCEDWQYFVNWWNPHKDFWDEAEDELLQYLNYLFPFSPLKKWQALDLPHNASLVWAILTGAGDFEETIATGLKMMGFPWKFGAGFLINYCMTETAVSRLKGLHS